MTSNIPIAVTSRSFSRHPVLRTELLERYSDVRFNDDGLSLADETLIEFARGRKKLITALERIDNTILTALPELEVIGKYGVGTDMLDRAALIKHGIRLGWTGGVNKRSVTELVVAFAISLLRLVPMTNLELRDGTWLSRKGRSLSDRTVGIIGCGHVGKDLTPILRAFGCKVMAHDILDFPKFYDQHQVKAAGLDEVLSSCDIVTLHVPLHDGTRNLLNRDRLALMKQDAILINIARGGLVDETALFDMLKGGQLAAAGFDVFAIEPPDNPQLMALPNFLATPHIGGSSEEAILAMGRSAIKGLDDNAIPTNDYPPVG